MTAFDKRELLDVWKVFLRLSTINKLTHGESSVTNTQLCDALVAMGWFTEGSDEEAYENMNRLYYMFSLPMASTYGMIWNSKFTTDCMGKEVDLTNRHTWNFYNDEWVLTEKGKADAGDPTHKLFLQVYAEVTDRVNKLKDQLELVLERAASNRLRDV